MSGTIKLVRNSTKNNFTYNVWGIEFDGEDSWSFDNYFARNVIIFGVDNSSPSHTNDKKKKKLVLGGEPADGINDNTGVVEKKSV